MTIPPKFQINTQFREEETEFSHFQNQILPGLSQKKGFAEFVA